MFWVVAALVLGGLPAAGLLAALLAVDDWRWIIPVTAVVVIVAIFASLVLANDGDDPAASVPGIVGYAFVAAVLASAAFGAGVLARRFAAFGRTVVGVIVVVALGLAHGYAAILIGLLSACAGQNHCLG